MNREELAALFPAEVSASHYAVGEWPDDERDYFYNGYVGSTTYNGKLPLYNGWTERAAILNYYRKLKAADKILAALAAEQQAAFMSSMAQFAHSAAPLSVEIEMLQDNGRSTHE